jgi:hypothetical protein
VSIQLVALFLGFAKKKVDAIKDWKGAMTKKPGLTQLFLKPCMRPNADQSMPIGTFNMALEPDEKPERPAKKLSFRKQTTQKKKTSVRKKTTAEPQVTPSVKVVLSQQEQPTVWEVPPLPHLSKHLLAKKASRSKRSALRRKRVQSLGEENETETSEVWWFSLRSHWIKRKKFDLMHSELYHQISARHLSEAERSAVKLASLRAKPSSRFHGMAMMMKLRAPKHMGIPISVDSHEILDDSFEEEIRRMITMQPRHVSVRGSCPFLGEQ